METSFPKIIHVTKRGISALPPKKPRLLLAALGFIPHQKSPSCQHSESLTQSKYINKSVRSQSLLLFLAPAVPQAHLAPVASPGAAMSGSRGTHPQTALGTAQTERGDNTLPPWSPHTWGGFSTPNMTFLHLCKQPRPEEGPEEKRVFLCLVHPVKALFSVWMIQPIQKC